MTTPRIGRTPRTYDAVGIGKIMTAISDLNSFCFVEPARRVLDETLWRLEEIRTNAMWRAREDEIDEEAA